MFYVTIVRDSRQVGVLAGPFNSAEDAQPWVERTRVAAIAVDRWPHFDAFGVSHIPGRGAPGRLNARLGLLPAGSVGYRVWRQGPVTHAASHEAAGTVRSVPSV